MSYEYKNELKELLPEYIEILSEKGITESRDGEFWNCPICGSGTGDNQTPAFHIYNNRWNCFSCGNGGDIYDLVAYVEKLPDDWRTHYNRTLKIMRPYLGKKHDNPIKKNESTPNDKEFITDYTEYLTRCHENVVKTDYLKNRGLSQNIIDRFHLGYDPAKNAITIPYDFTLKGYIHRILWDGDNKYCKFGKDIFNADALYSDGASDDIVFVTEGQIDALSFEEIKYHAVATGGVNGINKLISLLKGKPTKKRLVIAFDNDNAGHKATARMIEALVNNDIDCHYTVFSDIYGKYKDANEYLVADREGFRNRLIFFTHGLYGDLKC